MSSDAPEIIDNASQPAKDDFDTPRGCFLVVITIAFILGGGIAVDAQHYGLAVAFALSALTSFRFAKWLAGRTAS